MPIACRRGPCCQGLQSTLTSSSLGAPWARGGFPEGQEHADPTRVPDDGVPAQRPPWICVWGQGWARGPIAGRERLTPDSSQCNQRPCYLCPSRWGPPAPPDHGEGEEPRAHGPPTEPEVSVGWPRRWGAIVGEALTSCPPLPTVPRPSSCLQCPTALPGEARCPQAPSESQARAARGEGWWAHAPHPSPSWFPGSQPPGPVMVAKPRPVCRPARRVRVGPGKACCPISPSLLTAPHVLSSGLPGGWCQGDRPHPPTPICTEKKRWSFISLNKAIESSRKKGGKSERERERPIFYIICMSGEERAGEPVGTRPGQVGGPSPLPAGLRWGP